MDDGRVDLGVAPEDGSIFVSYIIIGGVADGHENADGGRGSFEGCVSTLIVNDHQTNLSALLDSHQDRFFNVTPVGVAKGCDFGDLCTPNMCPAESTCDLQNHACICDDGFLASGGQCVHDPCSSNLCENGADCAVAVEGTGSAPILTPRCTCIGAYRGDQCGVEGCGVGFVKVQACERCKCDPRGVTDEICDPIMAGCICKVSFQEGFRSVAI